MTSSNFSISSPGDAIVDAISPTTDDAFVNARGLPRGGMQLLTAEQADEASRGDGPGARNQRRFGVNSMAGAAAPGLDVAFIGQIASDQLGDIFAHDMVSLGVRFETPSLQAPRRPPLPHPGDALMRSGR